MAPASPSNPNSCSGSSSSSSSKVMFLGSTNVGKSALITTHFLHFFPSRHQPTREQNYVFAAARTITAPATADPGLAHAHAKTFQLQLVDMGGARQLDTLRGLLAVDADVFVLVFSLVDRSSFQEVARKWWELAQQHGAGPAENGYKPALLVGCKSDSRPKTFSLVPGDPDEGVGADEGRALARTLGCCAYVECSARTGDGVAEVWSRIVRLAEERTLADCELEAVVRKRKHAHGREGKKACVIM